MTLTWYGHSCFLLEAEGFRLVFDPYAPGSVPGLALPALTADLCLCSHSHRDHGYAQGVTLTGRKCSLPVTRIPSFHDGANGSLRGENLLTLVAAEGLRLAHLGDLGHPLTAEQRQALGRVDVLLIPVGGYFTIDADQAIRTVRELRPVVTVPMHFRGPGFGYEVIAPVDGFLAQAENVRVFSSNVLALSAETAPMTAVLRCPVAK